eukprot:907354-Rhodomonas_salina.1
MPQSLISNAPFASCDAPQAEARPLAVGGVSLMRRECSERDGVWRAGNREGGSETRRGGEGSKGAV